MRIGANGVRIIRGSDDEVFRCVWRTDDQGQTEVQPENGNNVHSCEDCGVREPYQAVVQERMPRR